MASNLQEDPKKKEVQPQLVKLNKAFHLAEQWVNNMSKPSANNKPASTELEGRPARLGIGAIVPKEYKPTQPNNPLERKLLSNLNANKKRIAKRDEELMSSAKDGKAGEDSEEDDEEESKAKAFAKRKHLDSNTYSNAKKKQK